MAEPIVHRLIMIATSSWRWPPDHSTCVRHAAMLADLLRPATPGRAWFCAAEPARRHLGRRVDDDGNGNGNGEDTDPDIWFPEADPGRGVRELMDDLRQASFELLRTPHVASLKTFRHRVFMDRERFLEVVGPGRWDADLLDIPFDVGLDFRFLWRFDELTCHVSTSVWSHTPWSTHHRPPSLRPGNPQEDLRRRAHKAVFEAVERGVVDWLRDAQGFREHTLRVFERSYRAPVFWVAVPGGAAGTAPLDYAGAGDEGLRALDVVGPLLGVEDPRAAGVSRAVLGDEVLVLRRSDPTGGEDVPRYLLLPGRPVPDAKGHRGFADQEDRLRTMITTLTDLEARGASELWSLQSDLEIWENQLSIYDHVVARGNALWDGLAGHLLQHRGKDLDKVHRSIELIHQTMLQGLADADSVATRVDRQRSRIPEVVGELAGAYAEALTERTVPGCPGLCAALTSGGPILEVSQRAEQIGRTGDRVARNYRDLVQGISDAFDERRVRETDVLQRTTFAVGLFVGLVGLVTVADTTVELQAQPAGPALWGVRALVWLGGLLLLSGLTFGFWRWARLGRLGSKEYRRTYRVVWEVLRYCSTDHVSTVRERLQPREAVLPTGELTGLEQLSEQVAARRAEHTKVWAEYDERIARRWADAWDRVSALEGDVRFPYQRQIPDLLPEPPADSRAARTAREAAKAAARQDLDQLARMIEKWSLRTFLVAERPLEMWKTNLPRLTVLYYSAMQLLGRDEFRVVSEMDFYFLLSNPLHDLTWEEVEMLRGWLDREIRRRRGGPVDGLPSRVEATDLLGAVEALGVRPGMAASRNRFVRGLGAPAPVDAGFDPFSEEYRADPASWRPAGPVVYSPRLDRWVVTGPAEVARVLSEDELFSSVEARRPLVPLCDAAAKVLDDLQWGGPLTSGGPESRADRRKHHEWFLGTGAVRAVEEELRRTTHDLVEAIRPHGAADLVADLLAPLPMRTVLRRLGLDPADAERLGRLADSARRLHGVLLTDAEQEAAAWALRNLRGACRNAVEARPDGPLAAVGSIEDRVELVVQAVLSGPASTTALLGNGLLRLLRPDAWARFGEDPDGRVDAAVEDGLRHATPVAMWRREATRAVTLGGVALPAGARILVHIAAANRASVGAGPHLSFGSGTRTCPSGDLVRAHARIVFTTLARTLPRLRLADGVTPRFTAELGLRGPESLLVEWDPVDTPANGPSQR